MKKTKRSARSGVSRSHKKTERTGVPSLVWSLVVIVLAGAIGWYAYQQSGGMLGAKAGTEAIGQTIKEVRVGTSNNEPIRVGQKATFVATAIDQRGQIVRGATYNWQVAGGTASGNLTTTTNPSHAVLSPTQVAGDEGYLNLLATASLNNQAVTGGKVVIVGAARTISRVTISPMIAAINFGDKRVLSANSIDQDAKNLSSGVEYSWIIVNSGKANGSFGDGDIRKATGSQVAVRATRVDSTGGWFNVILTATYNGIQKYSGTIVWVNPASTLASIKTDPKLVTIGSGKIATVSANAYDTRGGKMTDATITWSGVSVSGAKVEILKTSADPSGTSWATVRVTLPDGSKGAAVPIIATAKKDGVTKTDTSSFMVHP